MGKSFVATSVRLSIVTSEEIVPRFLKELFLKFHDVDVAARDSSGLAATAIPAIRENVRIVENSFFILLCIKPLLLII